MAKLPMQAVKFVHIFKAKGHTYAYYRRDGERVRIKADPGTPAFYAEIQQIEKGIKTPDLKPGTLAFAITAYKSSQQWADLKDATRISYDRAIDVLAPFAHRPLAEFTRPKILQLRDHAIFPKRGRWMANYCVTVLGIVLVYALDTGLIDKNPLADKVRKVRKPKDAEEANRPWEPNERATILAEAPPHVRLPIALAMCTGLRKADVFLLNASHIKDGKLFIRTSKTKQPLGLPIHPVLAEALAERPVDLGRLCRTQDGKPMTATGFDTIWQRFKTRLEAEGKIAHGLTFHGLRHTLGTMLSEAGLDDSKVADVLGQKTAAMAAHYRRRGKLDTNTNDTVMALPIRNSEQNGKLFATSHNGLPI